MNEARSEEHFDVIVIGAGLSGIGAGVYLKERCPNRSFVILEGRERMGGTWDLFRYPGIRSDSDMHTLGYQFKPWRAKLSIADGPAILNYIRETARDYRVEESIRYQHRVTAAEWSSERAAWRLTVRREETGAVEHLSCRVLYVCAGYYSYQEGYTPEFAGRDRFRGEIIHPQAWPEGVDYEGKEIVVIGSGATAVTLVPALAEKAARVTMLQRSPTYILAWPDRDAIANFLNRILPAKIAYAITRWKNVSIQQYMYAFTQKNPEVAKKRLLKRVRRALGDDIDVERHFTPTYFPWEERLCLAPNGDFFQSVKSGRAVVVTDHIESFTETGIALRSGEHLPADIIVTATGLNLVGLGEVEVRVDGESVDYSQLWTYKGVAYSNVPNLFACFGYVNASWTLRADLISKFVCRVLNQMEKTGMTQCTPRLRPADAQMSSRRWIDGFSPGYIERVAHLFPRQGDREPWVNHQNYRKDSLI